MKLTQQQLEAHLWGAANILRGKTAGQDYKNYILSLMFYKRLCDQWEAGARFLPRPAAGGARTDSVDAADGGARRERGAGDDVLEDRGADSQGNSSRKAGGV